MTRELKDWQELRSVVGEDCYRDMMSKIINEIVDFTTKDPSAKYVMGGKLNGITLDDLEIKTWVEWKAFELPDGKWNLDIKKIIISDDEGFADEIMDAYNNLSELKNKVNRE